MVHVVDGYDKRNPLIPTQEEVEAVRERVLRNTVAVAVHERIGDLTTEYGYANVLIVEGDHKRGVAVVMEDPLEIETSPPLIPGDIVLIEPLEDEDLGYVAMLAEEADY